MSALGDWPKSCPKKELAVRSSGYQEVVTVQLVDDREDNGEDNPQAVPRP